MNKGMRVRVLVFALALSGLVLVPLTPASAEVNMYDGNWHYDLAPYVWLPNINATLSYSGTPGGTVTVQVGPSDFLAHLSFAFAGYFEARKGPLTIFTDVMYVNLTAQASNVITVGGGPVSPSFNTNTSSRLTNTIWTLAAGKTVKRTETSNLDLFGGFRYLGATATVDWQLVGPIGAFPQAGTVSATQTLWDVIVGVKGQAKLGGNWFVPYYLDLGAGSSTFTWQGLAGLGYGFHWGDLVLSYRYLSYSSNTVLQKLALGGPMFAVNFRW